MTKKLYLELPKLFNAICYYNKTRKWGRLWEEMRNSLLALYPEN